MDFEDIEIVIAETGWPSRGDPGQVGVDTGTAAEYNRKLIQHLMSGIGTPLMPNRTFETYIFALFNEDLKPGPTCEKNFGLFKPDLTPVYDIGILHPRVANAAANIDHSHTNSRTNLLMLLLVYVMCLWNCLWLAGNKQIFCRARHQRLAPVNEPTPAPGKGKTWCLPKSGTRNHYRGTSMGFDCQQIQYGSPFFLPNIVRAHVYAMNAYYQASWKP